ncbi:MAG TPA: NAD(P)-binding domain-containing protein [Dactylosporangium sp.]|jgi:predicted dinucleotide-binding enzyme|nr:NAD(P)-binding domain-containing protein [Dactylosporangium sp.]
MKIGIIGSGHIGGTLTRRLRELGHDVTVANSRGPGSLAGLAAETGAIAGTAAEAAHAELVILAVPLRAVPALPAADLAGRIVIDADNYYPSRDGQISEIDGGSTSSRWTAGKLPGAQLVKVFNNIQSDHLLGMGRPPGGAGRIALPVAADDATAKRLVMGLVDELGFDPIDAGGLDDSWRQEPGTPVYGTDGDADEVRAGLAAATR